MSPRPLTTCLALALAAACSRSAAPSSPSTLHPPGIDRAPHLIPLTDCSSLETAIEDKLVLEMRATLEEEERGQSYGYPAGGVDNSGATPSTPSSFTTTNHQVAGVDEPDFVQNDGTRIGTLAGGSLHLATSWPADALQEVAAVPIEGWPTEFFLDADQAIVFSNIWQQPTGGNPVAGAPAPGGIACGGGPVGGSGIYCDYWGANVTKLTTIDISTLSAPHVTSEIYLPGRYVSARRIGDHVRAVLSDTLAYPSGVNFWPNVPQGATDAERAAIFADLAAANEVVIRAPTLADWLRRGSVTKPDGSTQSLDYACTDFSLSSGSSLPGFLTVATIDLPTQSLVSRSTVIAQGDVVYSSATTLYVASQHWWWWPEPGQENATYIHAFNLKDPNEATYLGSGAVDGTVSNQYNLDEYQGALRVATVLAKRLDDGTPWGTLLNSNRISVMTLTNGAMFGPGMLTVIGQTPEYGAGETTFGTRFLGPRGFVITARNQDPLYTFDLSDAFNPKLLGALAMPGFIAYLHPLDDTHLLGVGRSRTDDSGPMLVKIALLDVSDLSNPREVSEVLVGQGFAWSDALWDPKAFTWLPAQQTLAIPFSDYTQDSSQFVSDLRLFHVDTATGITPIGSLSMSDVFQSDVNWDWYWSPSVSRSILADGYVYAISDAGIRSAKVADLPAWLATVTFPPLAP